LGKAVWLRRSGGEQVKPDFPSFVSVFAVEVVKVLDYSDGYLIRVRQVWTFVRASFNRMRCSAWAGWNVRWSLISGSLV
jgi:hypothetical protein